MSAEITPPEKQKLLAAEQVIERGIKTFIEVGEALAAIRDARLYRESHDTFEAYCKERWGFTRMRASQLIAAAETSASVNHGLQSERQARELAKVEPERRQEVVERASEATDGKLTAKAIAEAARPIPHYEQQGMTKDQFRTGAHFRFRIRDLAKELAELDPQTAIDGSTPEERETIRCHIGEIRNYFGTIKSLMGFKLEGGAR